MFSEAVKFVWPKRQDFSPALKCPWLTDTELIRTGGIPETWECNKKTLPAKLSECTCLHEYVNTYHIKLYPNKQHSSEGYNQD